MDGDKGSDKVGKASLPARHKGEKGTQPITKNINREKSKERTTAHSNVHTTTTTATTTTTTTASHSDTGNSKERFDCGEKIETSNRSWTTTKSKIVPVTTKQTYGSSGTLQRKTTGRLGRGYNQKHVPSQSVENADVADGSGKGERDALSSDDITAHLRRLTEEHGKLQSEYARVRILLQDACIKLTSNDANTPRSLESPECANSGSNSSINQVGDGTSAMEPEKVSVEGNDDESVESTEVAKERFRREVLRLKESLLTSQQQVSNLTQSLAACKQEAIQERATNDELKQEISARGVLVEQLHKQVDQLKREIRENNSEMTARLAEMQGKMSDLSQTLKSTEKELKETKEFMQDENNSLTEAMREMEDKASSSALEVERLAYLLQTKEKHCQALTQVAEQMEAQLQLLQSKLTSTQDSAKRMLLTQGAEMSSCSIAIRGLYVIVEDIIEQILTSAEAVGIDLCPILSEQSKSRRSLDGRRLVQAILEAAKEGDNVLSTSDLDLEHVESETPNLFTNGRLSPMINSHSAQNSDNPTISLTVLVKDVESNLRRVGPMQETVNHYLGMLLNDSDIVKAKLEQELCEEKKKFDEVVATLEECRKQRWLCEERSKDLTLELADTKAALKEARESLQTMWNKIDERASWLIENQKMTEQVEILKKQCCELNAKNNFLESEIRDIMSHLKENKNEDKTVNYDAGNHIEKELALKRQVMELQTLLLDKDEELREKCKKYERNNTILENNLQKAEQEVQKLDAVIDGVLEILRDASDLHVHPVLKRLWEDLDGQSDIPI